MFKNTVEDIEKIFASGDAWLRKYGIVDNPIAHNSIIANLYTQFPKVKYVEYFLNTSEERKIRVVMHYSFFSLLFMKKDKEIDKIVELLQEYLSEYIVEVELKRYKNNENTMIK